MTELNQLGLFEYGVVRGAELSPCRTWRYSLWREWEDGGLSRYLLVIGLNPSTADESKDDNTITRCIGFAKSWGFGALVMVNAYGFRTKSPKVMQAASDPIGPGNDDALRFRKSMAGLILAAWGNHCDPERESQVCSLIGQPIYCLGKTKSGRPKHPLRIPAITKPILFWNP